MHTSFVFLILLVYIVKYILIGLNFKDHQIFSSVIHMDTCDIICT